MNRLIRYTIIFLLASLAFTSCYQDIDLDLEGGNAIPVINAIATPDTVVMASVTRTYTHNEPLDKIYQKDADVKLYVNGKMQETMKYEEFKYNSGVSGSGTSHDLRIKGVFKSTYTPKAGDKIEITASTKYGEAQAEAIVPQKVDIESVKVELRESSEYPGAGKDSYYSIKFHDPKGKKNYYFINIQYAVPYFGNSNMRLILIDPVFAMQNQDIADIENDYPETFWGTTFSDDTFDGQEYVLKIKEPFAYDDTDNMMGNDLKRVVLLYSVSEDYYKYLRSVKKSQDRDDSALGDLGFYEPVNIFSNIEGGVGILGAQSCSRYRVSTVNK